MIGRLNVGGSSRNTVIGFNNSFTATDTLSHYMNVIIGDSNSLSASIIQSTVIGFNSQGNASSSVVIGNTSCSTADSGIAIGTTAKAQGTCAIAIGNNACVTSNASSIAIGQNSIAQGGNATTVVGYAACANDAATAFGGGAKANALAAVALGYDTNASAGYAIAIGASSTANASCAIAIGPGAGASHAGAVALGRNITTEKTNTTHVQSLIAYGQAASKTNAIGATGGTVTIDWDNSNIQTLTLDSDISTLTKSNPIDGAVYTLFLTQGGTGGKTVAWGSDVEWPGGTPPTLSPTAGAVDAVSLVYIAGITGYYGNANLNFS